MKEPLLDQDWFEMKDIRRRKLDSLIWIPLRAIQKPQKVGQYGYCGYIKEFSGVGTLAVPEDMKAKTESLDWMDVRISHHHFGVFEHEKYKPSDIYEHYDGDLTGLHLVLEQHINSGRLYI